MNITAYIGHNPITAYREQVAITAQIHGAVINGTINDTVTLEAANDISGHKAIAVKNDGLAYYADANTITTSGVLGISTNAALAGDIVRVQCSGALTHSGWSFVPGKPVFVSSNGSLTQNVSGSAYVSIIGTAISATTLIIEVQQTVYL